MYLRAISVGHTKHSQGDFSKNHHNRKCNFSTEKEKRSKGEKETRRQGEKEKRRKGEKRKRGKDKRIKG
jgi:hypothetical protein